MKRRTIDTAVGELAALVERLIRTQDALHGIVREKLEAMRRCDPQAMIAASRGEGEIAAQVLELDGRRRAIVADISQALGIKHAAGGAHVSLRAIAAALDAEEGAELLQIGEELRRKMIKVAEANRVVELVSREMLAHFKEMFAAFASDEEAPRTYSRGGRAETRIEPRVLDAVG